MSSVAASGVGVATGVGFGVGAGVGVGSAGAVACCEGCDGFFSGPHPARTMARTDRQILATDLVVLIASFVDFYAGRLFRCDPNRIEKILSATAKSELRGKPECLGHCTLTLTAEGRKRHHRGNVLMHAGFTAKP